MECSPQQLLKIAKGQKTLLRGILVNIIATAVAVALKSQRADADVPPPIVHSVVTGGLWLCALVLIWIGVLGMARGMATAGAWTLAIIALVLAIVPIIGLLCLLVLNSRATNALKAAGVHVGLMGAGSADLAKLAAQSTPPPIPETPCEETSA